MIDGIDRVSPVPPSYKTGDRKPEPEDPDIFEQDGEGTENPEDTADIQGEDREEENPAGIYDKDGKIK